MIESNKLVDKVKCLSDLYKEEETAVRHNTAVKYKSFHTTNSDAKTEEASTFESNSEKSNKNSTPHSIKVYTTAKEVYEGEVDDNFVRNGYGVYKYYNGDIYEGEFVDGRRHGDGEYLYTDGSIYRGQWRNDLKNGQGNFKFDNFEFDGVWVDDNLLKGFTFKVHKFDHDGSNTSSTDSEFNEESYIDEDLSQCNSLNNSSFDTSEATDQFDETAIRALLYKQFELLNEKKYYVDMELIDIKDSYNNDTLMNTFLENKMLADDKKINHECKSHDTKCPFYSYTSVSKSKQHYMCNCFKLRRNAIFISQFSKKQI
jgi:hypothetical protein